jgi:hypothetical protein
MVALNFFLIITGNAGIDWTVLFSGFAGLTPLNMMGETFATNVPPGMVKNYSCRFKMLVLRQIIHIVPWKVKNS